MSNLCLKQDQALKALAEHTVNATQGNVSYVHGTLDV